MTIPPLRDAISYWTIRIEHLDWFYGWPVSSEDDVFVSPTGYPATKTLLALRTKQEAETFLKSNRATIDRRCASKPGFVAYSVSECRTYWPVEYHELVDLAEVGKKGRPRVKSQGPK